MIYMISYDIGYPDNNRQAVMDAIERMGVSRKFLTTTYLLSSNLDQNTVYNNIQAQMSNKDTLLVCRTAKPIRGWLTQEERDWIERNL